MLWSELAYSASDLFKFINDRAYEQAFHATNAIKYENIEQLLAFLDSAELFLEIGASIVAGDAAKWIVVSILQVLIIADFFISKFYFWKVSMSFSKLIQVASESFVSKYFISASFGKYQQY